MATLTSMHARVRNCTTLGYVLDAVYPGTLHVNATQTTYAYTQQKCHAHFFTSLLLASLFVPFAAGTISLLIGVVLANENSRTKRTNQVIKQITNASCRLGGVATKASGCLLHDRYITEHKLFRRHVHAVSRSPHWPEMTLAIAAAV